MAAKHRKSNPLADKLARLYGNKANRQLDDLENGRVTRPKADTPAPSPHKDNERRYDRAQYNRQRDASTPPPP